MSSGPEQTPDPPPDELRLAELLAKFQEIRKSNPSAGIGLLRDEAGDLFPELVEVAETMSVLEVRLGDDTEAVPAELGGYRILERIATGGAGIVYRAVDPSSDSVVAMKVMRQSLALGGRAHERFQREIDVTRTLGHPNIVPICAHGESEGRVYLVMDYVEGCSLAEVIRRLRVSGASRPDAGWLSILDELGVPSLDDPDVPPAEAYARRLCRIFVPVADALAAAGEVGLVHRDLKPANILLRREDGRLFIADFGVAKIEGSDITSTMAVLGTPLFMSPEQASGDSRDVDARTDVYGLGATLYGALTLKHPAAGPTFQETLAAIVQKTPPPISKIAPEYPSGLVRLVARCLEKDPQDRYPDAAALRDDLDRIANAETPRMSRTSPTRRAKRFFTLHRASAAALAFVLVSLLGIFAWLGSRSAELTIRTFPGGEVAVNGAVRGDSPWSGDLDSGEHEIVVTHDRFTTYREKISLEPGQTMSLDVPLKPRDPFDRTALAMVMEAHGIEAPLPEGEVMRMRGGGLEPDAPWTERVVALAPRGAVTRAGTGLKLRSLVAIRLSMLEITEIPGGRRVHQMPLSLEIGDNVADLPADVLSSLRLDKRYRMTLTQSGERAPLTWEFRLTDGRGYAAQMASYPDSVRREPHIRLLVANSLLEAGFFGEGFEAASALADAHPDRELPRRLALMALEGLVLGDSFVYRESLEVFDATTK